MLLKDCPVGSFVRVVSICGFKVPKENNPLWHELLEVKIDDNSLYKYVVDIYGNKSDKAGLYDAFRFEIVRHPKEKANRKIIINGKTYKLKPHTKPRLTVIDGVTYEMEEI